MAQLRERFQGDSAIVNRSLLQLKFCNRASFIEIEELPQPYSSFFPSVRVTVTALETEQLRWKSYWQRPDLGTYPTLVILIVKIIRNSPHHNCNCRTLIQEPQVH